jgi:hypothetical protein
MRIAFVHINGFQCRAKVEQNKIPINFESRLFGDHLF